MSRARHLEIVLRSLPLRSVILFVALLRGTSAVAISALTKAIFSIEKRYPHDKACFTEGLFLNGTAGEVTESCGLTGQSYIRTSSLQSGETRWRRPIPGEYFGEGISRIGSRLYVLTYRSNVILEYDFFSPMSQSRVQNFSYGEGWGLTSDGCSLYATTGDSFLYRLTPDANGTLKLASKVQVTVNGQAVTMLNEVEYVTPKIWVNVWQTNHVLRVDPRTGIAEMRIDLSRLFAWTGDSTPNGIAYSSALKPTSLLVTGKNWPHIFGLRLSANDLCGGDHEETRVCPSAPPSACSLLTRQGNVTLSSDAATVAIDDTVSRVAAPSHRKASHARDTNSPEARRSRLSITLFAMLLPTALVVSAGMTAVVARRLGYTALPPRSSS